MRSYTLDSAGEDLVMAEKGLAGGAGRVNGGSCFPRLPAAFGRFARFVGGLFLATLSMTAAEAQPPPFVGTWSRELASCSLSDDEDETRLRITAQSFEDYQQTCGMSAPDLQADGSYRVGLSCGRAAAGQGLLRVYVKGPDQAVFFTAINKRTRSRDGVRCPAETNALEAIDQLRGATGALSDALPLSKNPAVDWLKYRALCSSPAAPDRLEACLERRRLGRLLRSRGMCHYTRGTREGWRPCGERGG